ncbi:MAG: helix-turn-helix transcriptional regulator [Oscillospiraceae bacterium]
MSSKLFEALKPVAGETKKSTILKQRLVLELALLLTLALAAVFVLFMSIREIPKMFSAVGRELSESIDAQVADISEQYDNIALQGLDLSARLSALLEEKLAEHHVEFDELAGNEALLTELQSSIFDELYFSMQDVESSGAYCVLNSTINPELPNAAASKSGVYIKLANVTAGHPGETAKVKLYRGISSMARKKGVSLSPRWNMEIASESIGFFDSLMSNANNSLPLSRRYYWSTARTLPNSWEKSMFFCVPFVDKSGKAYGACGFEVNNICFKLANSLDEGGTRNMSKGLCVIRGNELRTEEGHIILSGATHMPDRDLSIHPAGRFVRYDGDGSRFFGMHREITLYPKDAAYENDNWVVFSALSNKGFFNELTENHLSKILLGIMLSVLALISSLVIWRKRIHPLVSKVINTKFQVQDTNFIPEIDDLIEFLHSQSRTATPSDDAAVYASPVFEKFMVNIGALSSAEKAVLDLYMVGCTAAEIADRLNLPLSTIKTHNKRIYMKLGVSSRKELMAYIRMMQHNSLPK